jgi:hypothetical protein
MDCEYMSSLKVVFAVTVCTPNHIKNKSLVPEWPCIIEVSYNPSSYKTNIRRKGTADYSPNSYIHVSVNDLYIPLIRLSILLQENRWAERENKKIAHRHMNVEIGTDAA